VKSDKDGGGVTFMGIVKYAEESGVITVSILDRYTADPAPPYPVSLFAFPKPLSFSALEIRAGYCRSLYCIKHRFSKTEKLFGESS